MRPVVARLVLGALGFLASPAGATPAWSNGHVTNGVARTKDMAVALTDRAKAMQKADITIALPDILKSINADTKFVAKFGKVSTNNYRKLQFKFADLFPALRDPELKEKVLRNELHALQKEQPDATQRELLSTMRERHVNLTQGYLYRIGLSLGNTETAATPRAGKVGRAVGSMTVQKDLELALAVAPPGVSTQELLALGNKVLVDRGLAPMKEWTSMRRTFFSSDTDGKLEQRNAELAAQIVAEYAQAAPAGTSAEKVLQQMRHDYPTLRRFGHYLSIFEKSPQAFVALKSFVDHGKLKLVGQGEPPAEPRFLGGWDPEKQLTSSQDGAARTKESSQLARIPLSLPLLDRVKERFGEKKSLEATNLLWVTHLYGDNYPLLRAMREEGLALKNAVVVGSPYGSSKLVQKAFAQDGVDVKIAGLDPEAYRKEVTHAIDRVLAIHKANDKRVIVIDDGGLVAEILAEPRYESARNAFRIVEQTTQGIMRATKVNTQVPVISVARSDSKRYEGSFIAEAVGRKLRSNLEKLGGKLAKDTVAVFGAGVIGEPLIEDMAKDAKNVLVVETDPARREALAPLAKRVGFKIVDKDEALEQADVVIGATGVQSLALPDLRKLKSGAVVVSASSKQVEFDMKGLAHAATKKDLPRADENSLANVQYRIGKKDVVMLGDGWPINLDHGTDGLPLGQIQLTISALFAGVVQAATLKDGARNISGIVPLDGKLDSYVLSQFKKIEREDPLAVSKMETWNDKLQRTAKAGAEVEYKTYEGKGLLLDPSTGQPLLGMTQKKVEALAKDWQKEIVERRGSVEEFTKDHDLKPHWVRVLRKVEPEKFPERTAVPTDEKDQQALAKAWRDEVLSDGVSAKEFLEKHHLSRQAMTELRKANPATLAPKVDNAEKGEAKIAELARLWKENVVTGKMSAGEFSEKHDISNQTLAYHRGQDPSLFPVDHPHKISEAQIAALSKVWKAKVVTGKMTPDEFFEGNPISETSVKRIRRDQPDLFPTVGTKQLSEAEVKELDRAWKAKVVTGKMTMTEFDEEYHADSSKISYLRTRFPDLFPRLRNRAD